MKVRFCGRSCVQVLAVWVGFVAVFGAGNGVAKQARSDSLWFVDGRATEQAVALLREMHAASTYGLLPRDYRSESSAAEIAAVVQGHADALTRQRFERAFAKAASRFVGDLRCGRVDAREAGIPSAAQAPCELGTSLERIAASRDVAAALASIEPQVAPYRQLKSALAQYRSLAADSSLTRLPPLPARSVQRGEVYAGAQPLRKLLRAIGDLPAGNRAEGDLIDVELSEALRGFQLRHGLTPDGVLGRSTFAALTTPLAARVLQIELSMERWRWLAKLDKPDIAINVPQFMLFALPRADERPDDGLEMRVIVGGTKPKVQTPLFAADITHVVFQPYWDVPRSILLEEMLPRIRRDLAFLERNDMEIIRGAGDDAQIVVPSVAAVRDLEAGALRLRQRPGAKNALGSIKFVMNSPYSVHLHATPEQELFTRSQRSLSHGCVRVSDPAALAKFVLRNAYEVWDQASIDAALCGSVTLRVELARPVRVVIFYATAVASQSGGMFFLADVYGHDRKLQRLLDTRMID